MKKIRKRNNKFLIIFVITFIGLCCNYSFAGSFTEVDGKKHYINDSGVVAKDIWVWIDDNGDSIAECYRFNSDGEIYKNYVDKYGKSTNDIGQLTENGEVVKKFLSSGEVLRKKDEPSVGIIDMIGNIISPKKKDAVKDKLTNRNVDLVEYEEIPIEVINNDGQIIDNSVKNVDILKGESKESGIIYANGKKSEISDNVKEEAKIVAGKDIRKFITGRNKCTDKVTEVYIYGGERWQDVIELSGNGASVKFNLNKNNYIYFEVSHSAHSEEDIDTDMSLEMYIDGKIYTTYDEFVDSKYEVVEEYIPNSKVVELKVNIKSGAKSRSIFIRNGRLKKIKEEE